MAGMVIQPARRSRSNRMLTVAALGLGLLTALLVVFYLAQQRAQQRGFNNATVAVVLASKEIPQGATISAEMVEPRRVTPDVAAQTAFPQPDKVIGQRSRYPIPTGAQIVPGMLVPAVGGDALSFVLPPGKRAVAVQTSNIIGGGNHIQPGDHVDVMVTMDASRVVAGAPGGQGVFTVLQNVEVLAVADAREQAAAGGPQSGNTGGGNNSVTLAVDPAQSQLLFLADTEGKIRLALRPFGDQDQQQIAPLTEPIASSLAGAGQPPH